MTPAAPVTLTRILHPCVLAACEGRAILFDPCFGTFARRPLTSGIMGIALPAPGIEPQSLPKLDAIAITHGHEDHFDAPGMSRIASRDALVAVPTKSLAARIRRLGFPRVEIVGPWEKVEGDGWSLTAVPARAPNAWREVSWVAGLGADAILHAGDTAWHPRFAEIRDRCAPRVACLPVNGVSMLGVRLTMTPVEAARAAGELRLSVAIPIHAEMRFGRLSRLVYRARGTERLFVEAARAHAPGTRVILAQRGAPVPIPPGDALRTTSIPGP